MHGCRAWRSRLRLSSKAHYKWLTASCAVCAAVACAACWAATAPADGLGGGGAVHRFHRFVALCHVALVALVYASMVGGDRLRRDLASTAAPRPVAVTAEAFPLHGPTGGGLWRRSSSSGGAGESGSESCRGEVQPVPPHAVSGGGLRSLLSLAAAWRLLGWLRALARGMWRRRLVLAVGVVFWWAQALPRMSRPGTIYFEHFTKQCIRRPGGGFLSALMGRPDRLAGACGENEHFRPVATGIYVEAFRQYKVCLQTAGGRYLSLAPDKFASSCVPENQFVFLRPPVDYPGGTSDIALASGTGTLQGSRGGSGGGNEEEVVAAEEEFCLYNPMLGLYLNARGRGRAQCGAAERWRIAPVVPPGPDVRMVVDNTAAMLHPHFASRAPVAAILTYLGVSAVLLHGRGWLAGGRRRSPPPPRWLPRLLPAKWLRAA
ncbi:unnamed protein product, partial [Phaeothamnion confervicola]